MSQKPEPVPEFSRPIARERLGGRVIVEEILATPRERAALARRFGLLGLDLLRATGKIEPADGTDGKGAGGLLRLSGHLSAELSQACVVTLEPVASRIEEAFTQLYSLEPGPAPAPAGAEVVFDPEAEEPPEPLGPGGLDLGEVVAQQLVLALDPYPRAPGAALAEALGTSGGAGRGTGAAEGAEAAEAGPRGGFAVLEALTRRA
jgi:uncharacterized metal-binding protein YceD (DUF177 family)